jgi:hypothetical protein
MTSSGLDIAPYFLGRLELRLGDEVVARMIWWPCHEGEKYPGKI